MRCNEEDTYPTLDDIKNIIHSTGVETTETRLDAVAHAVRYALINEKCDILSYMLVRDLCENIAKDLRTTPNALLYRIKAFLRDVFHVPDEVFYRLHRFIPTGEYNVRYPTEMLITGICYLCLHDNV